MTLLFVCLFVQVITPCSEHLFQTTNQNQLNTWVAALQETTEEALKHSNPTKKPLTPTRTSSSDLSKSVSQSVLEVVPDAMNIILRVPGNQECADCGSTVGKFSGPPILQSSSPAVHAKSI